MTEKHLRIVVGITGGIAAYKAVSVVRAFVRDGHDVNVIATDAALEFVGRPTLEAISRNPVHVSLYDDVAQVRHVALGQQADLIVIAPATANTLASLAAGLAPDLLGNTVLAAACPIVISPAMHTEMWENAATQANIQTLRARGFHIAGPGHGPLTGEDVGVGRMLEPAQIVAEAYRTLQVPVQDLSGKRILITAGGTREPLDPVRFIGNRSSGKQGVALARAAQERGAQVTLIAAHVEVEIPAGISVTHVSTTAEMQSAVLSAAPSNDVIIMAAAVADYRPAEVSESKLKKNVLGESPQITLVKNPDILQLLTASRQPGQTVIGFAAETEADGAARLAIGKQKAIDKGVDYLVVNHVGWSEGFSAEQNDVTILDAAGAVSEAHTGNKDDVAHRILDIVI